MGSQRWPTLSIMWVPGCVAWNATCNVWNHRPAMPVPTLCCRVHVCCEQNWCILVYCLTSGAPLLTQVLFCQRMPQAPPLHMIRLMQQAGNQMQQAQAHEGLCASLHTGHCTMYCLPCVADHVHVLDVRLHLHNFHSKQKVTCTSSNCAATIVNDGCGLQAIGTSSQTPIPEALLGPVTQPSPASLAMPGCIILVRDVEVRTDAKHAPSHQIDLLGCIARTFMPCLC
jgi:hypothetical protein